MKKTDFNRNWTCRCLTREGEPSPVTLPHDAMLSEPRSEESAAEGNTGWYVGGDYEYCRLFDVPETWRDKKLLLEFEGASRDAEVRINGKTAARRPYGYTNFYVDPSPFLMYGGINEIRVTVRNSEAPSSRWYPGTGLYRPVWLHMAEKEYIPVNGVRIRTVSLNPPTVEIRVRTSAPGEVRAEILREGKLCLEQRAPAGKTEEYRPVPAEFGRPAQAPSPAQQCAFEAVLRAEIPGAELWSCDSPALYTCRVTFGTDEAEEAFGIRELKWGPEKGLTINGERVILRGACVHHDNGVLGACAWAEAEERRVRILKENGYNALRSAHNPCSKALLEACDRLGMLMMDEYVDVWYIHKTKYDYVLHLKDWWQDDLREMVEKDYNHPCVIMYSTGNEVAETSEKKGIDFAGEMTRYLHGLDATRPVTCGINIFFNFLYSVGFGVYSDEKAEKQKKEAGKPAKEKKKHVGSDFYNTLAAAVGDNFMKCGATLHGCDVKTRDAFANMDIAGYNYGLFRYRKDLKKYPNRLILGSETFCKDAWSFWEVARDNPRIIGDFVWAGMDYLGETGEGAAEYPDYRLDSPWTRSTGGNGRVDLSGKPRAEAAYTRVALEQAEGPFLAVEPVYEDQRPRITGWQLTKALESWAWEGCEGRTARVEVYSRAPAVELRINGKAAGRKKPKKARAIFQVPYAAGILEAVALDKDGRETGRCSLSSAGAETELRVLPESENVRPGGLVFVPLRYTDGKGVWKPMEKHLLQVSVENGELLGLGNACPYFRGNYTGSETLTYFGEALAVVRSGETGTVRITVRDGDRTVRAEVACRE